MSGLIEKKRTVLVDGDTWEIGPPTVSMVFGAVAPVGDLVQGIHRLDPGAMARMSAEKDPEASGRVLMEIIASAMRVEVLREHLIECLAALIGYPAQVVRDLAFSDFMKVVRAFIAVADLPQIIADFREVATLMPKGPATETPKG